MTVSEVNSTSASVIERGVAAERSLTISKRLRLLAVANIAIVLMFIVANPTVHDGSLIPFVALRVTTLALLVGYLVLTYRSDFARYQLPAGILIGSFVATLSAVGGIMRGDVAATAAQHILVVLVLALVPWGVWWHAAFVTICALILAGAVALAGVAGEGGTLGTILITSAAASLMSIFVAWHSRTSFDSRARETLALRAAEERNRALNEQLEGMVRIRTTELADALSDQREVTRAISHDLRQPLRHIEAYTRLLQEEDDAGPAVTETRQERFGKVRTATARMWRMVDSLVAYSRISVTAVERKPFDLSGAVRTICSDLEHAQPDRNVEIAIEDGLAELCDPDLVRHLLRELVGNAWKFSRGRDPGRIDFGRESGKYFVRDNGAGFDMEHTRHLFHAFERLHHTDEFEGEGMGLAICERIVRLHGGKIWAASALDRGATFYFTLWPVPDPSGSSSDAPQPKRDSGVYIEL